MDDRDHECGFSCNQLEINGVVAVFRNWQEICPNRVKQRSGTTLICELMKVKSTIVGWSLAALIALVGSAMAQDSPSVEEQPQPLAPASSTNDDRPEPLPTLKRDAPSIRDHPIKVGEPVNRLRSSAITSVDVPERVQPVELKALLEKFRLARERYLREQKLTQQQLEDATEEQREELRAKLRENLEDWRELQKEFRAQAVERAREIRAELNQDLERVVQDGVRTGPGVRPRD